MLFRSGLLVNFAWLMGAILISLLLRVNGSQIKSAFRIYTPLLAVSFLVIVFRIILIPNELVNLIFPPVLVLCALWQWSVIRRHNKNIPKSDMFYAYITQAVFITSVVCSWTKTASLQVATYRSHCAISNQYATRSECCKHFLKKFPCPKLGLLLW